MILMMTMVINIRRVARNAPHPVGHVNLAGEHQRAAQQCHIFQREERNCDDSDDDDDDGIYSEQGDDDYPNYDAQQLRTCSTLFFPNG